MTMPSGIDLILADHRLVEALFEEFEQTGDAGLIGEVIDKLKGHDDAEQAALYPFAGNILGDRKLIERYAAAHSHVKKQFDLIAMQEGAPLLEAFRGLQRIVAEHVADEEKNLLPALADHATAQQLEDLGARIEQAKQRVG
jgi:hemerythrin superfamily protein